MYIYILTHIYVKRAIRKTKVANCRTIRDKCRNKKASWEFRVSKIYIQVRMVWEEKIPISLKENELEPIS